jgi:nitrogen fixation protein FixH
MTSGIAAEGNRRKSDKGGLTGKHVLMGFVAFFGVIFAVNGYFLYSALSTYTGIVAKEPYRKGLAYNDRIAAYERQAQLGWRDELVVEPSGAVRLSLSSTQGEPVRDVILLGTIGRPSTNREDRPLAFVSQGATYVADVGPLAEGNWVVDLAVRTSSSEEPVYRARRRVWLKP